MSITSLPVKVYSGMCNGGHDPSKGSTAGHQRLPPLEIVRYEFHSNVRKRLFVTANIK